MAHQGFLGEDLKDIVGTTVNPLQQTAQFQGLRDLPQTAADVNPPAGIFFGDQFAPAPAPAEQAALPALQPQAPPPAPEAAPQQPDPQDIQRVLASKLVTSAPENKALISALSKASSAADQGGSGFKFTDIFNVIGSLASDPNVAANSIGRAFERAGAGEFRTAAERKQARTLQKQQAQQALSILLEQGRNQRAANRDNITEKKFATNTQFRDQELEIKKERAKTAQSAAERAQLKLEVDLQEAQGRQQQLVDSLLAGAKANIFSSSGKKQIAKGLSQLSPQAARDAIAEVKAAAEGADRTAKALEVANRFLPAPGSAPAPEAAAEQDSDIITLQSGRRFNLRTQEIVE